MLMSIGLTAVSAEVQGSYRKYLMERRAGTDVANITRPNCLKNDVQYAGEQAKLTTLIRLIFFLTSAKAWQASTSKTKTEEGHRGKPSCSTQHVSDSHFGVRIQIRDFTCMTFCVR
jgi:hypothetical protein